MDVKRILRAVVCFVLVCCILVNCSPVKAKATSIVAGLTAAELLGYLTLIVGTTAGAVYLVNNREEVAAIGQSIIVSPDGPGDEDALDHLTELMDNVNGFWDAGGDGSDFDPRLGTKIAQGLMALIGGTLVTAIGSGFMEGKVDGEAAPEGYAYYNGYLFPVLPSTSTSSKYWVIAYTYSSSPTVVLYNFGTSSDVLSPYWQKSSYGDYGNIYTNNPNSKVHTVFYALSSDGCEWVYRNSYSTYNETVSSVVWSSFDLPSDSGGLYLAGSELSSTYTETITIAPTHVGDLPSQIENGDLDEEESKTQILAPLPEYIDITKIIKSPETAVDDLTQWQQQVIDNQKTLQQAIQDITADSAVVNPSYPDIGDSSGDSSTEVGLLTSIWNSIKALPQSISEKLGSYFTEIKQAIIDLPDKFADWFTSIKESILELPSKFREFFSDLKQAVIELPQKFKDWFENLITNVKSILQNLIDLPQALLDGFKTLLSDLFVPSDGYIDTKVSDLTEKYAFADSIAQTGMDLKHFLVNLGATPPIIYIDLGAFTGDHSYGGRVVFLDLTWYSQYKDTMDVILSAILWLWFVWRMMLALPGIIQGTSGFWSKPENPQETQALVIARDWYEKR